MRGPDLCQPAQNRAVLVITPAYYDRRALDTKADHALFTSLTHLASLVQTSPKVRESLASDGGLERLVRILQEGKLRRRPDLLQQRKWQQALLATVYLCARGSEHVRRRLVEAAIVPVLVTVLCHALEDLASHAETFRHAMKKVQQRNASQARRVGLATATQASLLPVEAETEEALTDGGLAGSGEGANSAQEEDTPAARLAQDTSTSMEGVESTAPDTAASASTPTSRSPSHTRPPPVERRNSAAATLSPRAGDNEDGSQDASFATTNYINTSPAARAVRTEADWAFGRHPATLARLGRPVSPTVENLPLVTHALRLASHSPTRIHAPPLPPMPATTTPAITAAAATAASVGTARPNRPRRRTGLYDTQRQPMDDLAPREELARRRGESPPIDLARRRSIASLEGRTGRAARAEESPEPATRAASQTSPDRRRGSPAPAATTTATTAGLPLRLSQVYRTVTATASDPSLAAGNATLARTRSPSPVAQRALARSLTGSPNPLVRVSNEVAMVLSADAVATRHPTLTFREAVADMPRVAVNVARAAANAITPAIARVLGVPDAPGMADDEAEVEVLLTTAELQRDAPRELDAFEVPALTQTLQPTMGAGTPAGPIQPPQQALHDPISTREPASYDVDVVWCLRILTYLTKYPSLRAHFSAAHDVPSLRRNLKQFEYWQKHHEAGFKPTGHATAATSSFSAPAAAGGTSGTNGPSSGEIAGPSTTWPPRQRYDQMDEDLSDSLRLPYNLFSIVEKFSMPISTQESTYWAAIVMRNTCRKDLDRGGIRQCAHLECGKWETTDKQFAKCRRCRRAKYCSKQCQSKAWTGHKWWCEVSPKDQQQAELYQQAGGAGVETERLGGPDPQLFEQQV